MISLKRSVSEYGRLESMQRSSLDCYQTAVEACGRSAVEIDTETTKRFREEVAELARQVKNASTADDLRENRVRFLGTLEDYAGKAGRYLKALEQKVVATSRALADLVESVRQSRSDERRLQLGLGQLHSIAQDPEISRLCPELVTAVETVEESVDHLRKQNQKVVGQLQEEVLSLRTALESAREAATNDAVSGVLNRCAMLERIHQELAGRRRFSLVFIWVSNLEYLYRRYGGPFRDDVLAAFATRLRDNAGRDATPGRWGEDRFVVLVPRPKPEAVWLADSFSKELVGPYVIKNKDWSREITLQTRSGVTEAASGASADSVLKAADKLLIALESINAPSL